MVNEGFSMFPLEEHNSLTKKGIAQYVSQREGAERPLSQQDLQVIVQHTLDCISYALAEGRKVELRNFGVFDVVTRKARVGRNPKKPTVTVQIPPKKTVRFRPGKELKSAVSHLGLAE
tara:strand:+ start:44 stop:397 length:354 start_codon:yes stop_codon:yes gene_type:complete